MFLALFAFGAFSVAIADNTSGGVDPAAGCLLASGTNNYAPLRITVLPYGSGRLRSPNFGEGRSYPPNSLCRWAIEAPPGHVIFLNISTLHIDSTPPPTGSRGRTNAASQSPIPRPGRVNPGQDMSRMQSSSMFGTGRSSFVMQSADIASVDSSSGCEGDYLEILDGADYRQRHQLIGRYCSDTPPRPIVSVYNEVQVVFQSDGFKEDLGFELDYVAVAPSDIAIGRNGRLHVQSLERITDDEGEFIGEDDNEIISARTRYELLDFPMSGPSADNVLMRPSSNLFIYGGDVKGAKSRSAGRAGDENSCSRGAAILTAQEGQFSSPNFGRGQYPPGSHCEWLVTAPRDRVVLLNFDELRLEYGLETRGCTFDYVEIFDGRDPTAPVLGRFCGRALPKVPIRSSSNYLFVVFQTDLSREDFGFSATYKIVSASPGCDGTVLEVNGKAGEITSPNFGYGSYPSNSECRWLIRVPDTFFVSLSFVDLDIESHGQQPSFGNGLNSPNVNNGGHRRCSYDFLEIFDGPTPDDLKSYGRFCGTAGITNMPAPIRANQNAISLVFRSDFSGERRGFRIQYAAVLPYPGCEGKPFIFRDRSGEMRSPNFGQDAYPPNSNCVWIVDPHLDHAVFITVSFMHFQVEGRYASTKHQVTCPYDFVEVGLAGPQEQYELEEENRLSSSSGDKFGAMISDSQDIVSSAVGANGQRRLCGQALPAPFTLRGRRLRVRFHSDFNKQDAGFWLRFEMHDPSPGVEPDKNGFVHNFKNKLNKKKTIEHSLVDILTGHSKTLPPETPFSDPVTVEITTQPETTIITSILPDPITEPKITQEEATTVTEPTSTFLPLVEETMTMVMIGDPTTVDLPAVFSKASEDRSKITEMGIESGEFMLVVDEDLTQNNKKNQHSHNENSWTTTEEPSTTAEQPETTTIGGIVIDESFMSGDGEYVLIRADEINGDPFSSEDMSNNSPSDDLKAVLFDPLPARSEFGELVPLDADSLLHPSVNVTLLSLFDVSNQQESSESSSSETMSFSQENKEQSAEVIDIDHQSSG